ncbi:MAG: hypothetical protein Q9193_006084 [Seirophora villosa]
MEALRGHPGRSEPPPELHAPTSRLNRLKDRLSCLPATTSSIVAPPPSPDLEPVRSIVAPPPSPDPEAVRSLSTATSRTTTTGLASDRSSAATSVPSFPKIFPNIFTVQKFRVSPEMEIYGDIKAVWTAQIKPRLSAVLLQSIPQGTCVQEFMMAGKRVGTMKPTLIITCGDTKTRRRVKKTFKAQIWLQKLLKDNKIMFVALVAETPLSAGPALNQRTIGMSSHSYVEALWGRTLVSGIEYTVQVPTFALVAEKPLSAGPALNERTTGMSSDSYAGALWGSNLVSGKDYTVQVSTSGAISACGLTLLIKNRDGNVQQHCTLGGLIIVNGEVLGLTTGHPLSPIRNEKSSSDQLEMDQPEEDSEDEDTSSNFSEPFVFNDDNEDDANENTSTSSSSHQKDANVPSTFMNESWRPPSPQTESSLPQAAALSELPESDLFGEDEAPIEHDWALLQTLPQSLVSKPNKVSYNDRRHDVLVEGIAPGPIGGAIVVLAANVGPQPGRLHSSPATMKIEKSVLEVQLITLENVLRKPSAFRIYEKSLPLLM